jgi:hypothetical protein
MASFAFLHGDSFGDEVDDRALHLFGLSDDIHDEGSYRRSPDVLDAAARMLNSMSYFRELAQYRFSGERSLEAERVGAAFFRPADEIRTFGRAPRLRGRPLLPSG